MVESKPEWVPERIWGIWLIHKDTNFIWENCADVPEYIEPRTATQKAILDPECRCVWEAMESRKADEGAVRMIFDAIGEARLGPAACYAETPHSVRYRLGKKIARLSGSLRETLLEVSRISAVNHRTGMALPNALSVPLSRAIFAHAQAQKASFVWLAKLDAHECTGLLNIESNLNVVLDALEAASAAWASTRPEITAKGSDPRRLHFIREMTRWFRQFFNTPLREQVAALTRCVYECDMNAATVAKLAP
ncbi:MAG: hypothetical protein ABI268_05120 [Rhodanobacter sp.]